MAQIYVSQSSPSSSTPSSSTTPPSPPESPPSTAEFHSDPILQYLNRLHCKLPIYDSALNEAAIEKELYATENETPSMDLLTCSSALTNGSAGSNSSSSNLKSGEGAAIHQHHQHLNRSKVESSTGLPWSCTGKHNPSLGLGPLAELFNGVLGIRAEAVIDSATNTLFTGQLKHSFPLHCYESCSQQQQHHHHPTQLDQIGSLHSRAQSAAYLAHHGSPAISQLSQSTPEPVYSCHSFSRDYGGLPLPPSAASYDDTDNYSYGYTQADYTENGYQLTSTSAAGNCTQLYSTTNSEEWYSIPPSAIVDGLTTKYNDNMDVHRLSGYGDYPGLNQASAGHYY